MIIKATISIILTIFSINSFAQNDLLNNMRFLKKIIPQQQTETTSSQQSEQVKQATEAKTENSRIANDDNIFEIPKKKEELRASNLYFSNKAEMISFMSSENAFNKFDPIIMTQSLEALFIGEGAKSSDFNSGRICRDGFKDAGLRALDAVIKLKKSTLNNSPPTFHADPEETLIKNANLYISNFKSKLEQRMGNSDCDSAVRLVFPIFREISVALDTAIESDRDKKKKAYQLEMETAKIQKENEVAMAKKRDDEKKLETQRQLDEERKKIDSENKRLQDIKSKRVGG